MNITQKCAKQGTLLYFNSSTNRINTLRLFTVEAARKINSCLHLGLRSKNKFNPYYREIGFKTEKFLAIWAQKKGNQKSYSALTKGANIALTIARIMMGGITDG